MRGVSPPPDAFAATRRACYTGYVTQAIVNNLAPLLFIVFQTRYGVSLEMLGRLVLLNFATQLCTDLVAIRLAPRFGYRALLVLAHVLAATGLVLLSVAPLVLPWPYAGLSCAIVVYAVGGGLLEVLVSPVVDALPAPPRGKAARMSLLHSFYCWGQVAVVAGTTLLLAWLGQATWYLLPLIWAVVPLANLVGFLRVPVPDAVPETARTPLRTLFGAPALAAALVLMLCAGAAELTMSQWASLFAERAIGVSKLWGDLAGPCLFAVFMGVGRIGYGVWGARIPLAPALAASGALATACYLLAAVAANPVAGLAGCAACGLAISLLWPGTFSLTAARFPLGGTAMFALLAVFGDAGGAIGPWLSGAIADLVAGDGGRAGAGGDGSALRIGLLAGAGFPIVVTVTALCYAATARTTATARTAATATSTTAGTATATTATTATTGTAGATAAGRPSGVRHGSGSPCRREGSHGP